jgi:hypothetical protein
MKLQFSVGDMEKHKVEFFWSQLWGNSWLAVDGMKVQTSGIQLSSPVRVIGKNETPSGWKLRVPYAVTRSGWKRFLPSIFGCDYLDIELVHRWTVLVGDLEQHRVVIEKERERWFAGLRPSKYRVFVDQVLVKECSGF